MRRRQAQARARARASAGAGARGRHLPLLQRATGKGVEQRWRELSDAQRAQIAQQHPVNAPRLAAEAAARDGAPKGLD